MPKKIIFLSMIKNESRIIKRCIQSALAISDAICIADTGSTDDTVEVLKEHFKTIGKPATIYQHEWKHFGHNRTLSFLAAQDFCSRLGWDPNETYALLLDADMQLVVGPTFDKEALTTPGYKIVQRAGSLEYFNTRFVKVGHPWKCVGVTHEYWDGYNTDTIEKEKIYIQDVGDGGCKADKFERDVRLLEQGLVEEPNNPRYLFYLAQSYKDSKQLDKAIEFYKKRIEAGGWYEEIWYSMYVIMKLYGEKGMAPEMEQWGLKAYEYRKERAENLLYMTRWFRDRRQYHKAWFYYELGSRIKRPSDLLFIESDCYDHQFDYERAIIHDYVYPDRKRDSIGYSIDYINRHGDQWPYNNLQWFVQSLPSMKTKKLHFQTIGDYIPTSTSFCRLPSGMVQMNVRYVNYRIQPNGSYQMSEGGKLSGDHAVRTDNYACLLDSDFQFVSPLVKMTPEAEPTNQARIKGMEDIRVFVNSKGETMYLGTTSEFSYDGRIRQYMGRYNMEKGLLEKGESLKPPRQSDCEKNWIPYKGDKIIYRWHPFELCTIEENGQAVVASQHETPRFLSHMRGSSTLVQDGDFFYGVTHFVMYQQPRKYYHSVVKIDARTDKLVGYTDPFYFVSNAIEYCLGYEKRGDTHVCIVSQNDSNPILAEFKDSDLKWRTVS
jgi:glycosyltransferase involved in cell wall biosynthesis